MSWNDYKTAAAMRDAIREIVIAQVNKIIPPPQFAVLSSVDEENRVALVRYPNEETSVPIRIRDVVPTTPGQAVVIAGRLGDRYIEAVIGSASYIYGADRIGTQFVWPGATAPPGSLPCDGRQLDVVEYTALFGVIGYRHGGSGTVFNIPTSPVTLGPNQMWCIRVR